MSGETLSLIDPPATSLLMTVTSPELVAAPPEIVNGELMPQSVREAMAATRTRRFPPRRVSIWHLRDVYVTQLGLVFSREGELFRPSITQHGEGEIAWAVRAVRDAGEDVPRHDRPLVLGEMRGAVNHGHWLIEMLPRVHLVMSYLSNPEFGVLVHNAQTPGLVEVMQTSLRRLGVADQSVVAVDPHPVLVRDLILVEGMSDHGVYLSPLVRDCFARLTHGIDGIGQERVYFGRGEGYARDFQDAAQKQALAADLGFHVVDPSATGLMEQMAIVRDARLLAGPMGAAMTALAFMQSPGEARLFAGSDMPDTLFWFIANIFGHRYREIRCAQDAPSQPGGYDGALLLDEQAFRRELLAG